MESLYQARKLYAQCNRHQASLTDDDKDKLESDIQRFIGIAIKEVPPKKLLDYPQLLEILKIAMLARERENSDITPVARGFGSLEKYFLLLIEQPWKPEFKKLKMYGGFYRTKIKSVLPDCEEIFMLAGYRVSKENFIMTFKGPLDKDAVLKLAFDCKVCAVECKTIAEHYKKMKNLSKSLADVVSYVLHDEWTREQAISSYDFRPENGFLINSSPNSKTDAPSPAVPKREPIINGSNVRLNMKYEAAVMPFGNGMCGDAGLHGTERNFKEKLSSSSKSPLHQKLSGPYMPPLAPSSCVATEGFPYIDATASEIIPELPQGTSEDHMRESLKLVNQQEAPRQISSGSGHIYNDGPNKYDDWSKYQNQGKPKVMGSIPISPYASALQSDIDEGIEGDMSGSVKYNPRYMAQQVILPSKPTPSFQQSFDQGYRTGPGSDNVCSPGLSQQIYHPPVIMADGLHPSSNYGSSVISRQSAAPPPIPSRSLKPTVSSRSQGEDAMDSQGFTRVQSLASNQPPSASSSQTYSGVVNQSPKLTMPVHSTTEPILRRDRLISGKSNSLKYPEKSSVPQAAQSRYARSMDLTGSVWYCHACTASNLPSDKMCSVCASSRQGPLINRPLSGDAKKCCFSCTYMNEWNRTHCDMCSTLLPDEYTFV